VEIIEDKKYERFISGKKKGDMYNLCLDVCLFAADTRLQTIHRENKEATNCSFYTNARLLVFQCQNKQTHSL